MRTILRMKKASQEDKGKLLWALGMVYMAEALFTQSKLFINLALSWDILQLIG